MHAKSSTITEHQPQYLRESIHTKSGSGPAMTSLPWFRMYHEFATDPKVQMLSEADQRRFVMVMCLRCCNGDVTVRDDELAFQLRISNDEWQATKARLVERELIDADNKPVNWAKRQQPSDSSKSRVSAHRERKKLLRNGDVTAEKRSSHALELDSELEVEEEKIGKKIKPVPSSPDSESARSEVKEQVFENDFEVAKPLRDRAEGLGLPVDDLLGRTRKARSPNPTAYFRGLCRVELRERLPGLKLEVIDRALGRDDRAFAEVCRLLLCEVAA